jgi:nicotinamidase-related amidase/type 1 glutamine amidotransferase
MQKSVQSSTALLTVVSLAVLLLFGLANHSEAAEGQALKLQLRSRTETAKDSGRFHTVTRAESWNANQTAIIVCDMWDYHHCLNAVRRGTEMAPRMNEVLKNAREQGATIIHAPSSCTATYADHAARKRAQAIKRVDKLPLEIGKWCYKIPEEERGKYPIDQTDGGEDDDLVEHAAWAKKLAAMGRNPKAPWKAQMDALEIDADRDFISDNGEEIWSILERKGCKNVILLGVHTNMCVLGRPFGLRQMAKNGKNVVLMRDMTDTMYNPQKSPFVSHFTGTDLIVEHIEKWVCPTITSDQILGGKPFRFKKDTRPHVAIVIAEQEYLTNETLPPFALDHLGKEFKVSFVFANEKERNDLPGIDVLNDADVLLLSVRRRVLPPGQMSVVRKYLESGKPIVGIRTANHALLLRKQAPPKGFESWDTWDADIFGGSYTNHYGEGPDVTVSVANGRRAHAILKGVNAISIRGKGSLYVVNPLAKSATPLLIGAISEKAPETIAWANRTKFGGKSFYTSLGHIDDFAQPEFRKLLANAVRWAASKD